MSQQHRQPPTFAAANAAREQRALDKAEDVLWLVQRGEDPDRAVKRVGTSLDATEKALKRQGRIDDWHYILGARPLSVKRPDLSKRRMIR